MTRRSTTGRRAAAVFLAAAIWHTPAAAQTAGDPEEGEKLFRACQACHQVGAGARNGIGPHLDSLFGRVAGSLDGFRYSPALRKKGEEGLVWDAAALETYLAKPQAMVPGTRMSFRGMAEATDRANLIAWLEAATAAAPAANPSSGTGVPRQEIGAAAMALDGDRAYGEYLSSECVTCHQITGRTEGIPSIVGWPKGDFIGALFAYKTNVRSHLVMQTITSNLGNEEIAALAAFFSSLEPR